MEAYLYNQVRASDVRDVVLRLLLEQVEEGGDAQPEIGVPRVEAVVQSAQPALHQDLGGLLRDRVGTVNELVREERSGDGVVLFVPASKMLWHHFLFKGTLHIHLN